MRIEFDILIIVLDLKFIMPRIIDNLVHFNGKGDEVRHNKIFCSTSSRWVEI
jgi:hypothetical protein